MLGSGKLIYYPMQKPLRIQPDCPVHIHAYSLAVHQDQSTAFTQIRLVNRSQRTVHSVFLQIEGKDPSGRSLYELRYVPVVGCYGQPHRDFGEEQPLFLPGGDVRSLELQVLDVLFQDGMIWRKQTVHQLLTAEEAGWETCSCGMKNPSEAGCCAYCGRELSAVPSPTEPTEQEPFLYAEVKTLTPPEKVEKADPFTEIREEIPFAEGHRTEEEPPVESEPLITEEPEPFVPEELVPLVPEESQPVAGEEPEVLQESDVSAAEEGAPVLLEEESLAQLLAPIKDRLERVLQQQEDTGEEGPDVPVQGSFEKMGEESRLQPEIQESPYGELMQETSSMLQELRRRMNAREQGRDLPVEEEPETEEQPEAVEDPEQKKASRGVAFWTLMVILLLLLGGAAFFGVLYFKGYFG